MEVCVNTEVRRTVAVYLALHAPLARFTTAIGEPRVLAVRFVYVYGILNSSNTHL
jgi:hypothetical protein